MSDQKKKQSFAKKTLLLIDSKEEFEAIVDETEQSQYSQDCQQQQNSRLQEKQKQRVGSITCASEDITVPRYGKVPQKMLTRVKKFHDTISTHAYFRQHKPLPSPQVYQPTSSDYQFVKSLKSTYPFNNKYTFSMKTFRDIIQSCQHCLHQHKTITVQFQAGEILNHLSFNLPMQLMTCFQIGEKKQLEELLLKVVEYWKSVQLGRRGVPLLRCYWPKTDVAMARYETWMPFKTRIIEESSQKKPFNVYQRKLSHTQKQHKITKDCKEASDFFNQVKRVAQLHTQDYSKFKTETIRFHKYAELYRFKTPQNLKKVTECVGRQEYKSQLKKIGKMQCFQYPVVKVRVRNSSWKKKILKLQRVVEVVFDQVVGQVYCKQMQGMQIVTDNESSEMIINNGRKQREMSLSRSQESRSRSKKKIKLE